MFKTIKNYKNEEKNCWKIQYGVECECFSAYLFDDPLVGVEIEVQLGVVLFDDDPSGLFDRLGTNSAHFEAKTCEKLGLNSGKDHAEKEARQLLFWRHSPKEVAWLHKL